MTPDLAGAALLSQRHGAPVWLFERSAAARAKASQSTVEAVLDGWAQEAGLGAASDQPPAASPTEAASPTVATSPEPPAASPTAATAAAGLTGAALLTAVAGARGMPESIIERSANARASAAGVSLQDVLHEWAEDEGLEAASPAEAASDQPPAPSPTVAASPEPPAASPTAAPAAAGLTGAALLTAVAGARGMPESLVERSAKARASAAGVSLEAVLHEWAEDEGLEAATSQPPAPSPKSATSSPLPTPKPKAKPVAPVAAGLSGAALLTAVAEARGMPESLVERSAKARAKKTDASVDDVLSEWAQEAGLEAASDQPPAASPTEAASDQLPAASPAEAEPSSSSPSGGGAAAGGGGGQALTGAALLTAVAEARGMPESLVERSAKARAKKTDASVDDVLNEWAQEAGLGAASPQPPAASPAEAASPTAEAASAEEAQDGSETPDTDVQEPDAAVEAVPRPVKSWRHAVAVGAIAALVPLLILIVFAIFADVPSELSEAPWYLLGLEPFLSHLKPFISLVIIPGVVLAWIVILPIVAWNPAVHPSIRRMALMALVLLVLAIAALTIVGAVQT